MTKNKNNKKLVQAWITNEQYDELAKIAKDFQQSKTSLVLEAVTRYIYHWNMPSSSTTRLMLKDRLWVGTDKAAEDEDCTVYRKGKEIMTEEDYKAQYYQEPANEQPKSIVDQFLKKDE